MLTLGQAAQETGMAKSAISRAIKSGRLSARKTETGSFEIDPAELFRVYPPASSRNSSEQQQRERDATQSEQNTQQREIVILRELIEEVRGERDSLRGERDRLLRVIEEQTGTVKLLTHHQEQKTCRVLWGFCAVLGSLGDHCQPCGQQRRRLALVGTATLGKAP